MENIKYNLMTKDDLSYEQIYHRLLDITTKGKTENDMAYRFKNMKKPKCTEKLQLLC